LKQQRQSRFQLHAKNIISTSLPNQIEKGKLTKVVSDKVEIVWVTLNFDVVPFRGFRSSSISKLLSLSRPENCHFIIRFRFSCRKEMGDRSTVVRSDIPVLNVAMAISNPHQLVEEENIEER